MSGSTNKKAGESTRSQVLCTTDRTRSTRSNWTRKRLLLACFAVVVGGAACIVSLSPGGPNNDLASVVAVGDVKTNGEDWTIFRFDAPRGKAASIYSVQVIGVNNFAIPKLPGDGTVLSTPDSIVPIWETVKRGHSKYFKVRQVGGGEWRLRLELLFPLSFPKQHYARMYGCFRSRSLKPWARNYIERNHGIVESQAVSTTEAVIQTSRPPPPPLFPLWGPLSPTDEVFPQR